ERAVIRRSPEPSGCHGGEPGPELRVGKWQADQAGVARAVFPKHPQRELQIARDEDLVGRVELADVVMLVASAIPAVTRGKEGSESDLLEDLRDLRMNVLIDDDRRTSLLRHPLIVRPRSGLSRLSTYS